MIIMKDLRFDLGDIVYGTWRVLDEEPEPTTAELAARLEACAEYGIRYLDTAEIYGLYRVEEALGRVFKESPSLRESLGIVTKGGIDVPSEEKSHARLPHYNATGDNLVACAEKSLKLLGIDTIDLFLVHRPDVLTHPEDTAAGLQKLLDAGKIRQAGVSNYTIHQFAALDELLDRRLATNQVEYSPFHMDPAEDGTFEQCIMQKVRPMAWSPLGGGTLFDPTNPTGARLLEKLKELGESHDQASPDVLVYAWILTHPVRPTVILGTNKTERIESGVSASGIELSRQEWYTIWEAAKGHSVP